MVVLNVDQVKSRRWRRVASLGAVHFFQDVSHLIGGAATSADREQRADDGSNHVVKKAVAGDVEPDEIASVLIARADVLLAEPQWTETLAADSQLVDGPHAAGLVGPVRFEAAEIVRARQHLGGFVNRGCVQWAMLVQGVVPQERVCLLYTSPSPRDLH